MARPLTKAIAKLDEAESRLIRLHSAYVKSLNPTQEQSDQMDAAGDEWLAAKQEVVDAGGKV